MLDLKAYKRLKQTAVYKPESGNWFDESYPFFFNSKKPIDKRGFIELIAFAYSWMPTIPSLGKLSDAKWEKIKASIARLNQLNDDEFKKLLKLLIPVINNSLVGTSKVLHFLEPESMPIIDSRVIKVWNKTFNKDKETKLKTILLAKNNLDGVVDNYIKYRNYLMSWRANCKNKVTLRQLESVLYYQKL